MKDNFYHTFIKTALFAILFCCSAAIYAQNAKCSITGQIIDDKQLPIAYASVAIYNGNSPIAGTITDNDGRFSLKIQQTENSCLLVIEFVGYNKCEKRITPNTSQINLGVVSLKEDIIFLNEVVVTAKEAAQKSNIEHTTINASANMAAEKGSAIDILRTASSVNITNDEISIRGNSNILVLIDGIPTTTSDLSTIPAANIKSIEVITNPDASHDSGGTGGIINIISKKSLDKGLSGVISASYGFNHFATGNIALSYNKEKTLWRFSYNTKYEDDIVNSTLSRKIESSNYEVFQKMRSTRYTFNNNISVGADFNINDRNRLSVDLKAIIPRLNIEQELHNTFTENKVQHEESRYNDVTWNRENIEGSVAYSHIIKPKVSDITVRGSVSKIWGHRPSYYLKDNKLTNRSVSGGSPFIAAIQADYKHKFKPGTLSTGIKLTYRRNDIYHRFYKLSEGNWKYSEDLSNDLLHTELVPALYAMFASGIGKKFSYKVGLRGELSSVTLNSRHDAIDNRNNKIFVAPSLSGTYAFSEKHELSLALSRRTGRPTYPQLNPYMSMVDATTYEKGNMHLSPEEATKLDLSYNFRSKKVNLFANGYMNYTSDYISQITMLNKDKLITTYINADSDIKTGVELSLKIMPTRWMDLSINANSYYTDTDGTFEGADIANNGWTNNSNISLDFEPWKGGDLQLQYYVTTPQYFPQLTTTLTHQMNAGIKQRLLKRAMTLSILVTDILNTAKWEVWSDNHLFDLTNISYNKSRMVWLGISYNFNSFKQKGGQKSAPDRSLIKLGM